MSWLKLLHSHYAVIEMCYVAEDSFPHWRHDHWEGRVTRMVPVKFLPQAFTQHPNFHFTLSEASCCVRVAHVDRWLHHPLLKRCECREHLLRKSICKPPILCYIAPFDWHSTLKGREKNNWSITSSEQMMLERGLGALLTPLVLLFT